MQKTVNSNLKIYTTTIDGLLLAKLTNNQQTFLYQINSNVYTISEDNLLLLGVEYSDLVYTNDNNILFWKIKSGITDKSRRLYIVSEEFLVEKLGFQKSNDVFQMEEILNIDGFKAIFEKYQTDYKIKLYKTKLNSFISNTFIDQIIDEEFIATVINFNENMWIYLLGKNFTDEVIDYYQQLYFVNTEIILQENEEIVPFDNCEFIPFTFDLAFLGYKNGIYNPFNFPDLNFRIGFYNSIKEDLSQGIFKILDLKDSLSKINIAKIKKEISKFINLSKLL